ncbi:MAG: ABC transporter substrate-binding protein [Chitinophagales bacterium]
MKKIQYLWAFLGIILVSLCFMACGGSDSSKDSAASDEPTFFRYNQATGISSLDPAFAKDLATMWAGKQLFNGLVQTNDKLEVLPCIAKNWTISDDGLTYTFTLRDDVFFHNHEAFESGKGPKVTAQDFVYSFNRIIDPAVASTGAWLFNGKVAENEPFKAIDAHTLEMRLKQPFRPMLGILSMQYCSVVPKQIVEKYGKAFRSTPVGTGPFQLKVWKEGEVLIMTKNPSYFEKNAMGEQLPLLDGVRVSFMENKRNEYLKFKEGKLDLISGLDAAFKDDVLTKDGKLHPDLTASTQLLRSPYINTEYLGFLTQNNPNKALEDKRVRQAINYGFDREKMVRFLRNNVGIPANAGFVPSGLPSFDANKVKGYTHNPDKARDLLKAAGYPNGEGLPEITLETTEAYRDLCTFIQGELEQLGIKIKMELHPSSFLRSKIAKGESSFFRASWIGDYPDAETYLTVLNGSNPSPPNYTRFNNADYNKLYTQALLENDDAKRYALYQAMDNILIEEAPIVPLFYDEVLRFVRKDVKNLGINAFNLLDLKAVHIK